MKKFFILFFILMFPINQSFANCMPISYDQFKDIKFYQNLIKTSKDVNPKDYEWVDELVEKGANNENFYIKGDCYDGFGYLVLNWNGHYIGNFKNGKFVGIGQFGWPDRSFYIGRIENYENKYSTQKKLAQFMAEDYDMVARQDYYRRIALSTGFGRWEDGDTGTFVPKFINGKYAGYGSYSFTQRLRNIYVYEKVVDITGSFRDYWTGYFLDENDNLMVGEFFKVTRNGYHSTYIYCSNSKIYYKKIVNSISASYNKHKNKNQIINLNTECPNTKLTVDDYYLYKKKVVLENKKNIQFKHLLALCILILIYIFRKKFFKKFKYI